MDALRVQCGRAYPALRRHMTCPTLASDAEHWIQIDMGRES